MFVFNINLMELKEFITGTITSICDAIIEMKDKYVDGEVIINPEKIEIGKDGNKLLRSDGWHYIQDIDFDISILAENTNGIEGSTGLKVFGFVSFGGTVENANLNQSTSRVKFKIPIAFPTTETPEKYKSNDGKYAVG